VYAASFDIIALASSCGTRLYINTASCAQPWYDNWSRGGKLILFNGRVPSHSAPWRQEKKVPTHIEIQIEYIGSKEKKDFDQSKTSSQNSITRSCWRVTQFGLAP
jgi:hypothetical protein